MSDLALDILIGVKGAAETASQMGQLFHLMGSSTVEVVKEMGRPISKMFEGLPELVRNMAGGVTGTFKDMAAAVRPASESFHFLEEGAEAAAKGERAVADAAKAATEEIAKVGGSANESASQVVEESHKAAEGEREIGRAAKESGEIASQAVEHAAEEHKELNKEVKNSAEGARELGRAEVESGDRGREGAEEAKKGFRDLLHQIKEDVTAALNLKEVLEFSLGAGGIFFIIDKLKEVFHATVDEHDAIERLRESLALAGDTGEKSAEDMADFAEQIERVTQVGKEAALTSMSLLVNEAGLTGESLKAAEQATIGLASRMHIDLETATNIVTRVLTGHTDALMRYGFSVDKTKTPLENIIAIIKQGQAAFPLATNEVNTMAGAWKRFKNEIDSIYASIGGAANNLIPHLINGLTDAVKGVEAFGEKVVDFIAPIADTLKEGFVDSFNTIKGALAPFLDSVGDGCNECVERVRNNLVNLAEYIADGVRGVAGMVAKILPYIMAAGHTVMSIVRPIAQNLASLMMHVAELLRENADLVKGALLGIGAVFAAMQLVSKFKALASSIAETGKAAVTMLSGLSNPLGWIMLLGAAIGMVITKLHLWGPIINAVKSAFEAVWNYVHPMLVSMSEAVASVAKAVGQMLLSAVMALISAVVGLAKVIGHAIKQFMDWTGISGALSRMFSHTGQVLKSFQEGVVYSCAVMEFAFSHWKEGMAISLLEVAYHTVKLYNQIEWVFTVAVPTVLRYLMNNWREIFTAIGHNTELLIGNLANNIVNVFKSIPGWIAHRKVDWAKAWTPVTEGFEEVFKKFPGIADRAEGETEKALRQNLESRWGRYTDDLSNFIGKRMDEAFKPKGEKHVEAGKEVGKSVAEGMQKGVTGALNFNPLDIKHQLNTKHEVEHKVDIKGSLEQAHRMLSGVTKTHGDIANAIRERQAHLQEGANHLLTGINSGVNDAVKAIREHGASGSGPGTEAEQHANTARAYADAQSRQDTSAQSLAFLAPAIAKIAQELDSFRADRQKLQQSTDAIKMHTDPSRGSVIDAATLIRG